MNPLSPPAVAEILIVEDSLTQAEHLRFVLEDHGFAVRHGRNGVEGLALLHGHRPMAVISDINMPEMDGFELCRRVREDPAYAGLPIILLTSLSDPEDVIRALECGASYFFTKPFDEHLLVPRLRYLQENQHLQGVRQDSGPVSVQIGGTVHRISSDRLQTLNLLLSTYESAVAQNQRLQRTEAELRQLNENLELRVRERTIDLIQSNDALVTENTARRQVEARLREQAELLDKANEAIITVDLEDRIKFWNCGAERLFGWSFAEMVGHPLSEVFTVTGHDAPREASRVDWRGEIHSHHRSGDLLILETSFTILRDEQGRPTGRFSISTDITEKKKLEEKFLRAQRLESIGMLAAGIAHDLNNVLAPIGMASSLLRSRLKETMDLRMVDTLEKSVNRGAGLVKQILGFAQGVSGEHRLVQVKHLVRDITAVIARTFPKSITLEENVPTDLWPVSGNATQIHQVLLNLCVNARDAMPAGGRLGVRAENCRLDAASAAAIESARPGAWIKLEVSDTGTGIPPEVLARIWEPFFTTKNVGQGTGLGLSTVRGIVETHHGFIAVETVLGQGTTFRVFLPAAEFAIGERETTAPFAKPAGKGECILLADDEESIRETTCEILTSVGYQVVTAQDGANAAALFIAEPAKFALVITDFDMPGMDGEGFTRIVRSRRPEIKVLVMSGFASRARVRAGQKEFGDARLSKPFSAEVLLKLVEELVQAASAGT